MNKNLLFIGIAVLVLLVLGSRLLSNPQPAPTPSATSNSQNTDNEGTTNREMVITLAEQNNSEEMGTATLIEQNGQVVVTLDMTGAPTDVAQPAHIHTGSCPNVGGVVHPLTNVLNGVSVTTLDTTFQELESNMPLGLNVHKSTSEASVYVSCGDLSF